MRLLLYFIFLTTGNMYSFPIYVRHFLNRRQYVSAEMGTFMPISDELGPSIFCRKTEKALPVRKKMDGKVVYFPPELAFLTLML